jgi:hypothetical protein
LGGKVETNIACVISGNGQQCVTVDQNGVVRKKCLSK